MSAAKPVLYGLVMSIIVMFFAACASMTVDSDRYAGADFSGYKTFAWISNDPMLRPRGAQPQVSALNIRRIQEAIEIEFSGKGYTQVDTPADADFVVTFTVGTREHIDVDSYPAPYRGPWVWGWYGREVDVHTYREGTLAIDIFDSATRQPVWHGRARKEITGADVSDPAPVIKRAVAAILGKFPSRK